MHKFTAKIYKIGINPVVDPPKDVLSGLFEDAGRSTGPIPVAVRLNGRDFVQTLVKYGGAWRLYINGRMLKDSGLAVGDTADIGISFDQRPREIPVPVEFSAALGKDPAAKRAFDGLAPSRRKEILRYLGSLKTGESLLRNIQRLVRNLAETESGRPHIALKRRDAGARAQKKDGD